MANNQTHKYEFAARYTSRTERKIKGLADVLLGRVINEKNCIPRGKKKKKKRAIANAKRFKTSARLKLQKLLLRKNKRARRMRTPAYIAL